jgi:hypothetical protein
MLSPPFKRRSLRLSFAVDAARVIDPSGDVLGDESQGSIRSADTD